MMVKNEARSIRETLKSIRPYIDCYTILDTGSTDETVAYARQALEGVPGNFYFEPFINYGVTRTRTIELAGESAVFTLMLSGDETVRDGAALRRFCEEHREATGPTEEAYFVRIQWGNADLMLPRLLRAGTGWRYLGATHEYLCKPGFSPSPHHVPNAVIFHDLAHADMERKRATWEKDLALLTAELNVNPKEPRAAFYRAQTLEDLGRLEDAFEAYRFRVSLEGFREEVFQAKYRMAKIANALGRPWPEVQQLFLDAFAFFPHRAEPLQAIAEYWMLKGQPSLAFLFASRGYQLSFPAGDLLCIEKAVYEHLLADIVAATAFYVGEFGVGEDALAKVLQVRPDDPRLIDNLGHYIAKRISSTEGWMSEDEAWFLVRSMVDVILRKRNATVVEIGSCDVHSTIALASVLRAFGCSSQIHAIDPHASAEGQAFKRTPQTERFQRTISGAGLSDWVATMGSVPTDFSWTGKKIDLLYMGGLHDYENLRRNFEHFSSHLSPGATVFFRDYGDDWPGVRQCVDEQIGAQVLSVTGRSRSLIRLERTFKSL